MALIEHKPRSATANATVPTKITAEHAQRCAGETRRSRS
jgi:hypothetical protein